jgi:hypothetical protein
MIWSTQRPGDAVTAENNSATTNTTGAELPKKSLGTSAEITYHYV